MISDFVNVKSSSDFLKWLVVFLLVLLVNVLIIRFLWNTVLVKHISILRPVGSLFDTLLLAVALTMFHGKCMTQ
jgi:hypothetical protein